MAFDFETVKQSVYAAGKEVGDKAKEASAVAKLKVDIHTKQDFVEKQFAELGRLYYEAHKDEDVSEKEAFASIEEALQEINRLNDEMLTVQGAVVCPQCGAKQSDKHMYCETCGAKIREY